MTPDSIQPETARYAAATLEVMLASLSTNAYEICPVHRVRHAISGPAASLGLQCSLVIAQALRPRPAARKAGR